MRTLPSLSTGAAFILVKPPFLSEQEALYWADRSLDFAFSCGAAAAALIPFQPEASRRLESRRWRPRRNTGSDCWVAASSRTCGTSKNLRSARTAKPRVTTVCET